MIFFLFLFLPFSLSLSDSLPTLSFCFSQTPEELEDDSDFEQEDYDTRSRTSVQTEDDQLIAGQSARVSGCSLPLCAETSQECPKRMKHDSKKKKKLKRKHLMFWLRLDNKPKSVIQMKWLH